MTETRYYFEINFNVTTQHPHDGYCSDVEIDQIATTYYTTTEKQYDPDEDFIRTYCEKDGSVDKYGLYRLSYEVSNSDVWCNCSLKTIWTATSAILKKESNIRDEFLNSSNDEYE